MGFSRQEYWGGLLFPPPGDLCHPGTEPTSPALAGGFFTTETPETPRSQGEVKWSESLSVVADYLRPHGLAHGILQARILKWVAFTFSTGSSQPRDWTQVSWIAGEFFTNWAIREAQKSALVQFSSVTQSCLTLCDPMNHSTPGLPVHHQLPEFTHKLMSIELVMPSSHLILCRPLLLLLPIPPSIRVFSSESTHEIAKVLEFQLQHQSFQWTPRTDLLEDVLVGSPCSPSDSQESSPTPQFKSINFSALTFLHSPTLTSIHWKNHSLD